MKYQILIEKPAEKFIVKLPKPEKENYIQFHKLKISRETKIIQNIRKKEE